MATVVHKTTFQILSSVNTPDFDPAQWLVNPDLTALDGVPTKYWKLSGNAVIEMTQTEKDAVDAANLPEVKRERYADIDLRTAELIEGGFEFPPASGLIFSLSDHAQSNLLGMKTMLSDPAFTYPVEWNLKDDSSVFSIPDEATAASFYATAVGTVRAHLDSGTAIKSQIRAATSEAEVAAVTDPR
jgi:hypothetical protein